MSDLFIDQDIEHSWSWLEDETWQHLTNVMDHSTDPCSPKTIGGQLADLCERWGADNLRIDDVAYDCDRKPISGVSVFVKREAFKEKVANA